jgi:hypothetical protein
VIWVLRLATLTVGCLALVWASSNFTGGANADLLRDVESRLLQFETLSQGASTRLLEIPHLQDVSDCDSHSQRALLLLEIPLAQASLRSGATLEYERHIQSLEARTRRVLACSPDDSFAWLVAFGLQIQHGILGEHTFDLLAMSYQTSPSEGWLAVRRVLVAVPVVLVAPEPMQRRILAEFETLVRHRFVEAPARAYQNASVATRALLLSHIDGLDQLSRKAFSEALQKLRS